MNIKPKRTAKYRERISLFKSLVEEAEEIFDDIPDRGQFFINGVIEHYNTFKFVTDRQLDALEAYILAAKSTDTMDFIDA